MDRPRDAGWDSGGSTVDTAISQRVEPPPPAMPRDFDGLSTIGSFDMALRRFRRESVAIDGQIFAEIKQDPMPYHLLLALGVALANDTTRAP